MVGSIGNLYGSVEELDAAYACLTDTKDVLLSPAGGYNSGGLLRLPEPAAATISAFMEVYQCNETKSDDCCYYVAVAKDTPCRHCGGAMNVPLKLVGPSGSEVAEAASLSDVAGIGFVQGVMTFTVMDDLTVKPLSMISGIAALNAMGVTDISYLKEKTVRVGHNEGLEVLRASLQSKTVLTDVFLALGKKSKAETPANAKKGKGAQSMKRKRKG
ncbi:hypothetical protein PR202_ga23424 [Eleusine coracana subsp. coracana]|uniref:Uncharacterized protein n=1 Tax=Eleusine coracana subsp. coracana TaxID=191504 RepID=A0AAV5D654_ELECO|nr:hypothetical protein QOZ80_1AG0010150 [Eleusine coracana subsp. coracana]GJN05760.1 hypothetical protein PR202_ga23424 [Eleusine coracana subsp. coracana]